MGLREGSRQETTMSSCQSNEGQWLAYRYALLEPDQRQDLEAHLAQCASCRASLARAQGQQRVLAAAARAEFPQVHFAIPAADDRQPATGRAVLPKRGGRR